MCCFSAPYIPSSRSIRLCACCCLFLSHAAPLFRISSKENTSHIYKGRHLAFNGFRCILAPAPSHLRSSTTASPADKVPKHAPPVLHLSRLPSAQRHRRRPQAAGAGTSPPSPSLARSNSPTVPPHDCHLGQAVPQARRCFTPHPHATPLITVYSQAQQLPPPPARRHARC
jgi:hypothetical protein